MSDWLKRPLDGAQLAYAEDDVRYLEQLYTSLRDELTEKNRLTWVSDECAKYEEPEFFAGTGNSHSLQVSHGLQLQSPWRTLLQK